MHEFSWAIHQNDKKINVLDRARLSSARFFPREKSLRATFIMNQFSSYMDWLGEPFSSLLFKLIDFGPFFTPFLWKLDNFPSTIEALIGARES